MTYSIQQSHKINYESNQQDATIQVNLLVLVSSTCFGRFSPIIGSTRLHLQYLVVFTQVAAGKHRPKHVELTRKNKLTCIVAACLLLS
jgi:predicted metalloprotease with PDZ domain